MKPQIKNFIFNNKNIQVEYRPFVSKSYSDKHPKTSRAYVFVDIETKFTEDDILKVAQSFGLEHAHTHVGDFPEVDKAWNKHNREIVKGKREILNMALEILWIDISKLKISFSRYAGCSCPCSPGFIIDGLPDVSDIYIDYKDKE